MELWLFVAAYVAYNVSRWVITGHGAVAQSNTRSVVGLEGRDGLTLATLLSELDGAPQVVLHPAVRSDLLTVAAALAGATATVAKGDHSEALLETIRAAGRPGTQHERPHPFARGRVLAHVEPRDRAIAAMRLVDTPVTGIAEALRMAPADVAKRIVGVLRRLSRMEPRGAKRLAPLPSTVTP